MFNLEIDFFEELEPYLDMFGTYKVRGNKFIACSPFRQETHPSFAVNLDTGTYIDSGETDDYKRKGDFIKLLSFLMETDYDTAKEYLIKQYDLLYVDLSTLNLKLDLSLTLSERVNLIAPKEELSVYLYNRGISPAIQRMFGIHDNGRTVAFPIHDHKGNLVNIKYRSIQDKVFWYADGGKPVKQYLYGLDLVKANNYDYVFVTEGEIDTQYLWGVGSENGCEPKYPSVATFGATVTDRQIQLLRSSGFKEIILATDNDKVGRAFNKYLASKLLYSTAVSYLQLPKDVKDVNELEPKELHKIIYNRKRIEPSFLF